MSDQGAFFKIAYRFLQDKPLRFYPGQSKLRDDLLKGGISVGYTIYISAMFFWTLVITGASLILSTLTITFILPLLNITLSNFMFIIVVIIVTLLSGVITLITFIYYPKYKASQRRIEIDKNLVYTANYMFILQSAGATPEQTILSLAKITDFFGVKSSTRAIIRDVELMGFDVLSALNQESKRVPSSKYADLLQGYIATLVTGGSLTGYLSAQSRQLLESRKRFLTQMIRQLDIIGEVFIAALVALPVILISMLAIMGGFGGDIGGGISPFQAMIMIVYVLIPFTGIFILLLVDGLMSGW